MHPVGFQEVDQENDAAAHPGDGIGPGNGFQLVPDLNRDGNVGNPEYTPADEHGVHGDRCFARAPHDAGDAVGEGQQAIEQADGAHVAGTEIDGLGGTAEEANELGSEDVGKHTDGLRHDHGAGDAEAHTFLDPVILVGTQVLAHEGGQGHGEAGDRQEGKALQLGVGTAAGHGGLAEAVDIGLNHHIGDGDHGILNAGGQAKPDDIA